MSAVPDARRRARFTDYQLRLAVFLRDIANSPENAVFAIVTDSASWADVDVVRPLRELAEDAMVRADFSLWRVFGRRLYLIDREDRLRGARLHGIWLHSCPGQTGWQFVASRLVEGGQLRD